MFTTISMAAAVKQLFDFFGGGDFPETVEQHIAEHKIDVDDVNQENYTPLMAASKSGRERTVRKLIDLGAKVNATSDGSTALIEAAYENQLEVMLVLIEKGADVNFVDQEGYTALMWAATQGHLEAVTLLLKAGANVNHINEEGETALDLAIANRFLSVARKIASEGGKCADDVKKKDSADSKSKGEYKIELKRKKDRAVEEDSDEESDEEEEDDDDEAEEEGDEVKIELVDEVVVEGDEEDEEEEDEEESEEEPEDTWLDPILTDAGTPPHLIYLVEDMLVRQEGFGSSNTLARVPPSLFHRAYLEGLGIKGLGLQQTLLDLHADLHHEFVQQKRQSSNSKPHTSSGTTTRASKDRRSGEPRTNTSEGRTGAAEGPATHTRISTRSTAEEARSDNDAPEQQQTQRTTKPQREHKEVISAPKASGAGIAQQKEKDKEKDSATKEGVAKVSKKRQSGDAASEGVESESTPAKRQSGAGRDAAAPVEVE